ncbi:bifunctional hydroxymethylpyrimidine kinase/phosphomethylpyrimidine kinase [Entomobacter blattae]|uniref:hydroxymethylpyrimidine kinase n=1 Tax=Entomobacter blattae TaxID=2762277 RepID=A0A7H1NTD0_9PROT|nr:bifunctional hydroxymethylpyrimidine kinase/phosphomethylpyrimidine kinase [Entomobacter blattae]QNT79040.1 Hydroxymethylpyrimidine/phosphomethylpyrimidine kinase [Entomobacter blattae]
MRGRVLVIAGSDSGGGAGIQADIKTITMLNGYAATALTALTAQNTLGVQEVFPVPPTFVKRQLLSVLDDIGADAIKIGMLHSVEIVEVVAKTLSQTLYSSIPLIIDPVMQAKGGDALLQKEALERFCNLLLTRAFLLTPNIPEAEILVGFSIKTPDDMKQAALRLHERGVKRVLVKGGHLAGDHLVDLLLTEEGIVEFTGERIPSRHTHGTGCTLASAISIGLAQGLSVTEAVKRARTYLIKALKTAPGYGAGAGPINHSITIEG